MARLALGALALAISAAHADPKLVFHGDGRVTAVDGQSVWDVTGWMPNSPEVKLNDPKLRHCFDCFDSHHMEQCSSTLEAAYAEVCKPGQTDEERKAVAKAYILSPEVAAHWCEAGCDFKNISAALNADGLSHEQSTCVHLPEAACHGTIAFDARRKQTVEDGTITRSDVAHPAGFHMEAKPLSEEEQAEAEAAGRAEADTESNGEPSPREELRIAQMHLEHALADRDAATLPPAPRMCSVCAASGLESHSCHREAEALATKLCIEGTEDGLCAGVDPGCFPLPKQAAHHAQLQREEREADIGEDGIRHGGGLDDQPLPAPEGAAATDGDGSGNGVRRLTHGCAHAVIRICMDGLVMPTVSRQGEAQVPVREHASHPDDARDEL